jgi:excisionase family DNA binding protein
MRRNSLVVTQQVGIGEASKKLGLSRTSIQKLVDSGQLIAVKTAGGHRRILQSSLDHMDEKIGPKAMQRLAVAAEKHGNGMASASSARLSDLGVLIVEDDAVTAAAITTNLAKLYPEITCVVATDGLDAVLQIERRRPSVLITDLNMTPYDGFSLIKMVSSRPEYRSMSIVVISGLTDQEIQERGGLPANVLFYQKPLSIERLKGFFDAHVQLHRQHLLQAKHDTPD